MMTFIGTILKLILAFIPLSILSSAYANLKILIVVDIVAVIFYIYTDGSPLQYILNSILDPLMRPSAFGMLFKIFFALSILLLPIINLLVIIKNINEEFTLLIVAILLSIFIILLFIFIFGGEEYIIYISNYYINLVNKITLN